MFDRLFRYGATLLFAALLAVVFVPSHARAHDGASHHSAAAAHDAAPWTESAPSHIFSNAFIAAADHCAGSAPGPACGCCLGPACAMAHLGAVIAMGAASPISRPAPFIWPISALFEGRGPPPDLKPPRFSV